MVEIKRLDFCCGIVLIFYRFQVYIEDHVYEKNRNPAFQTNWLECFLLLVMISDRIPMIYNIECPDITPWFRFKDNTVEIQLRTKLQSYFIRYLPMSPKEAYQCIQVRSRLCWEIITSKNGYFSMGYLNISIQHMSYVF